MNSAGSGNWSTGATWVGGVAPTAADAAVILNTHVVTLTDTTCVCDSLTINSGGQLAVNGAADTKLIVDKGIAVSSTTGYLNLDMSAAPTKKCEIYVNNDNFGSSTSTTTALRISARVTMKGAQKTAWTLTSAAMIGGTTTNVHVDDATGWLVADKLVFATTQAYNATPKTDAVTIATITFDSGTTGPATVTWTDGTGAGGSVANNHADNCLVGNFTRNLIFGPATANNKAMVYFNAPGADGNGSVLNDVEFRSCGSDEPFGAGGVVNFSQSNSSFTSMYRCSFWEFGAYGLCFSATSGGTIPRDSNLYYSTKSGAAIIQTVGSVGDVGTDTDMCVFRGVRGIQTASPGATFVRPKISGLTGAVVDSPSGFENRSIGASLISGGGVWACKFAAGSQQTGGGELTFKETWLGKGFSGSEYSGAGNDYITSFGGATGLTFDSCPESTTGGTGRLTGTGAVNSTEARFLNRDGVATNQDIYRPKISLTAPCFVREATEIKNANAAMRIDTLGSPTLSQEFEILVKGGATATIFLYVKKNAAYNDSTYTLPSATLSGLGITPVTDSGTNVDDTWELLDLSYASGAAPSADGVLTLTLSAQSATATGKCYFSGIPIAPFVTRARHYAYIVNETGQTLTADPAIDPAISQATAAGYSTEVDVTWGASSTIATLADTTFKKMVHLTAAEMISNVASALPITWAGAYGSPAIFAQGAINISGDALNGSGSIDMGAHTLTATTPFAYTYTGGTFSQATTVPSFSGGTLNIGAAGTFTYTQAASMLVIVTPTSPSTYDLSGGTFTGTLTVNNAAAHAITVTVPAGTTTSDTGNTGGAITFSAPAVERGIAFTGLQTGTSIQVFTSGTQTKLFGDNSTAGSTFAFDDATSGSITVDYTVQKAGYFPQRVTGVVLVGAVGGQVDVVVAQVVDRAYVASSGLTYGTTAVVTVGTNPTTNPGTKTFQLTTASTGQNWYSFWIEQWIDKGNVTGEALANVEFPLAPNGPNSFTLNDGWTFSDGATSIAFLTRDGLRYLNTSDVLQKAWAAILTSGAINKQVRYQQSDGGTTNNGTMVSNEMDQLVQIYDVGVYDRRGYLVLKIQAEGYDQAEVNVVTLYGNLEDQLYAVGLAPLPNGIATGDPALTITITREVVNDVTSGKTFGIKIVSADSGEDIMRELRYNLGAGGEYPAASGYDGFDWHDLVQQNGSDFKTVRGNIYGTAAVKGVVVYSTGTTLHPDFTLLTADDGTTYSPPVVADVSITGMPNVGAVPTRLQIINQTAEGATAWAANTVYATGAIVKRVAGLGSESTAGLYFRATTGGTSKALPEPVWDTVVGNPTTDNTVTWKCYAILFYDADPAATSIADTYIDGEEFLAGEIAEIRFAEMNDATPIAPDNVFTFKTYDTTVTVATTGFSASVVEESDTVFTTFGLDGAAYETTYSPDFVNDRVVLDTNTDFTGASAFAYYCYTLTTSAGMYDFWGGVTAIDAGNIRINDDILDLYFDCSSGFVKQTDSVRVFRNDGARPALDPVTAPGWGIEINWRTPVNVVSVATASVLSPTESAQLMSLPSATDIVATAVDGATTLAESLAIQNSILAGKVSGAATGTEVFRDLADTKDRIVSTVDGSGNRSSVVVDGT